MFCSDCEEMPDSYIYICRLGPAAVAKFICVLFLVATTIFDEYIVFCPILFVGIEGNACPDCKKYLTPTFALFIFQTQTYLRLQSRLGLFRSLS